MLTQQMTEWLAGMHKLAGTAAPPPAADDEADDAAPGGPGRSGVMADGEDDMPPVSMQLGAPPRKPRQPPKPTQVKVAKKDGEHVGGNARAFEDEVRRATDQITNTAKTNLLYLGQAIGGACADFQSFAGEKVEKIKKQEEFESLVADMAGTILKAVTAGVAGPAEGIGKEVVAVVIDLAEKGVNAAAKAKLKEGSDGFTAMVADLVKKTSDLGTQFQNEALKKIESEVNKVSAMIKRAKDDHVSPEAAEWKMIDPFIGADTGKFEVLVQRHFGVPARKKANRMRLAIMGGMIEAFMVRYIIAANPGKGMEWNIAGTAEPREWAHKAAVHEQNKRYKELKLDETE